MPFSKPEPGLIINYLFLWPDEADKGEVEGVKMRPCAIVVATEEKDGGYNILAVPITHTEPDQSRRAIELQPKTKRRLGLDEAPSWIITDCLNRFVWPGPDLRPLLSGDIAFGLLPKKLTELVRLAIVDHYKVQTHRTIKRGD